MIPACSAMPLTSRNVFCFSSNWFYLFYIWFAPGTCPGIHRSSAMRQPCALEAAWSIASFVRQNQKRPHACLDSMSGIHTGRRESVVLSSAVHPNEKVQNSEVSSLNAKVWKSNERSREALQFSFSEQRILEKNTTLHTTLKVSTLTLHQFLRPKVVSRLSKASLFDGSTTALCSQISHAALAQCSVRSWLFVTMVGSRLSSRRVTTEPHKCRPEPPEPQTAALHLGTLSIHVSAPRGAVVF